MENVEKDDKILEGISYHIFMCIVLDYNGRRSFIGLCTLFIDVHTDKRAITCCR